MFIAVVAYALVFGMVSVLLQDTYSYSSAFAKYMRKHERLLSNLQFEEKTRNKILQWAGQDYEAQTSSGILLLKDDGCPSSLKHKVVVSLFGDILTSNVLFVHAPKSVMMFFGERGSMHTCIAAENVITEKDLCEKVFITIRGKTLMSSIDKGKF